VQAVRQLTSYIEELRAELAKKDETILSLGKELAQAKPSLQQGKNERNTNPRIMAPTDPVQPPKSTKTPAVEVCFTHPHIAEFSLVTSLKSYNSLLMHPARLCTVFSKIIPYHKG
jgi:hypothetical protein